MVCRNIICRARLMQNIPQMASGGDELFKLLVFCRHVDTVFRLTLTIKTTTPQMISTSRPTAINYPLTLHPNHAQSIAPKRKIKPTSPQIIPTRRQAAAN